jgi:uncharacterized protein (DUF58 family)
LDFRDKPQLESGVRVRGEKPQTKRSLPAGAHASDLRASESRQDIDHYRVSEGPGREAVADQASGPRTAAGESSPASLKAAARQGNFLRSAFAVLKALFRWTYLAVTAPLRGYLSLRRSMTHASVIAMLVAVMSLNVIWGFPWSGMMGGSVAMLLVGFALNRLFSPRLKLSVSLPRSAIAGHPFLVNVRLTNRGALPAMNLRVGWHREGLRELHSKTRVEEWDASPPVAVGLVRSGDQMLWHGAMRFDRRGIHPLPPFQVASAFPFHLFQCRRQVDTETSIAITPAPLNGDDDPVARVMLAAIGDWAKQLIAGAPVEYIGNREYQVGMPVRRWDFASWARLGRPIVREYQSPSVQCVNLIVDTSHSHRASGKPSRNGQASEQDDEAFERLLSVAATAISELSLRRVQMRLYLTSEPTTALDTPVTSNANDGTEPMLVRLADADPVAPEIGGKRIQEVLQASRGRPALILSLFDLDTDERSNWQGEFPPNVTYLPIKAEQTTTFYSGA